MAEPLVASAPEIEAVLGIPASTVRSWVFRGLVRRYGRNQYDVDDILALVREKG